MCEFKVALSSQKELEDDKAARVVFLRRRELAERHNTLAPFSVVMLSFLFRLVSGRIKLEREIEMYIKSSETKKQQKREINIMSHLCLYI